jgi:hypothetical protein
MGSDDGDKNPISPQAITLFEDDSTAAIEDPPAKDKYSSQSIYWVALNRSMTQGVGRESLICIGVLVVQFISLNAILFQNTINVPAEKLSKTFAELLAMDCFEERIAIFGCLLTLPLILAANLSKSSEFYDSAVFAIAILWYSRQPWATDSLRERLLLGFWLGVHAIRTFLLIPLFAFVNAQFLANQHDVRMVFLMAMATGYLLDFDDLVFRTLYMNDPRAGALSSREIGVKTAALCDRICTRTIQLLVIVQMAISVLLKQYRSLTVLWLIPALGLAIFLTYIKNMPRDLNHKVARSLKPALAVSYTCVTLAWVRYMWPHLVKPLGPW